MKKLFMCLTIIVTVLLLTSSSSIIMAQENYQVKITEAMTDLGTDVIKFSKDMQSVSKGELNLVDFLESAENHSNTAKELLKKVISYDRLTENKSYHANIVSLFANWILSTELIINGVKEDNTSKIESANNIMVHITKKMESIAEETQLMH